MLVVNSFSGETFAEVDSCFLRLVEVQRDGRDGVVCVCVCLCERVFFFFSCVCVCVCVCVLSASCVCRTFASSHLRGPRWQNPTGELVVPREGEVGDDVEVASSIGDTFDGAPSVSESVFSDDLSFVTGP